jgi:hypothetical protein
MFTFLSVLNLFLDISRHRAASGRLDAYNYFIVISCLVGFGLLAFLFAPEVFKDNSDREVKIWGYFSIAGVMVCFITLIYMWS